MFPERLHQQDACSGIDDALSDQMEDSEQLAERRRRLREMRALKQPDSQAGGGCPNNPLDLAMTGAWRAGRGV